MGLFDKIKDNARDISKRAIEGSDDTEFDAAPDANVNDFPSEEDTAAPTPEAVIEPTPEKPEQKEEPKPAKEEKLLPAKTEDKPKIADKPKEEKSSKPKSESSDVMAKARQPYYKSTIVKVEEDKAKPKTEEPKKPASANTRRTTVIDITPQKIQDPVKREIYARERAAMSALASQRKMNGSVPLYVTSHLNFKTRVFINRIEYSGSFGKNVLPIETVGWVKLRAGGTGIIIETTAGKRVVMVVKPKDRLDFADAVMKVQELQPKRKKFKDTQTVRIDQLEQFTDDFDELEKLAKLKDKGIVSQEEFDIKKKKILGI